jgi:hypothetical protein
MWGVMLAVASGTQFILLQLELYKYNAYPYLILPFVAILTYLYFRKKDKKKHLPRTIISNILQALGTVMGANFMILGFFFWSKLEGAMVPIFMIMLAFWLIISGVSIRYRPLLFAGIVLNLMGLGAFHFDQMYHPLIISIACVLTIVIPGILLQLEHNKNV